MQGLELTRTYQGHVLRPELAHNPYSTILGAPRPKSMSVFQKMLEDKKFRNQILDGNVKIDHIVGCTQVSLQQTVLDLAEGVSSTRVLNIYLVEQEDGQWRRDRPGVIDIYNDMKGNTDGWSNEFIDLQA
jgi:hypothetical protein